MHVNKTAIVQHREKWKPQVSFVPQSKFIAKLKPNLKFCRSAFLIKARIEMICNLMHSVCVYILSVSSFWKQDYLVIACSRLPLDSALTKIWLIISWPAAGLSIKFNVNDQILNEVLETRVLACVAAKNLTFLWCRLVNGSVNKDWSPLLIYPSHSCVFAYTDF